MQISDVVLMFCLLTGKGSECRQKLMDCLTTKQSEQAREYVANESKKGVPPDKILLSPPSANWPDWILECANPAKKEKKK